MSYTLTVLAFVYVLWLNYVIFKGGNVPLSAWHLTDTGDAGAGTFMLFIGDWIIVLAFHLVVAGSIEYALTGLLQPRHRVATVGPAGQPGQRDQATSSVPPLEPSTPIAILLGTPTGAPTPSGGSPIGRLLHHRDRKAARKRRTTR